MSSVFDRAVFQSLPAFTQECLRSIEHQINANTSELCARRQGDFMPAAESALISAVHYCQSR